MDRFARKNRSISVWRRRDDISVESLALFFRLGRFRNQHDDACFLRPALSARALRRRSNRNLLGEATIVVEEVDGATMLRELSQTFLISNRSTGQKDGSFDSEVSRMRSIRGAGSSRSAPRER